MASIVLYPPTLLGNSLRTIVIFPIPAIHFKVPANPELAAQNWLHLMGVLPGYWASKLET